MALDLSHCNSPPSWLPFHSSSHGLSSNFYIRRINTFNPSFPFHRIQSGVTSRGQYLNGSTPFSRNNAAGITSRRLLSRVSNSTGSSSSEDSQDNTKTSSNEEKVPFGYTRKDVLLIGLGATAIGFGLKGGLEYFGVDPLQAGNVVQLVMVVGLTLGWISTYIFRVSNKEMTYAQQLRDYENKVMQKRLEGLTEAELEALLEQVEEEKRRVASGEQVE